MGDHAMSTLKKEQSPPDPPQTEPLAEAPLAVASSKTPENDPPPSDSSLTEPQTENVPPKKVWYRKWKWPIIIVAAAVSTALIVLLGVCIGTCWRQRSNPNNPNLVLEKLAAYYKKTLDENVEPCEDFYSFVCSNLMSEYEKENQYRFDTMKKMEKSARLSLDDLLTKPPSTSDSAMLRQLKTFHQACINTTKVEAEGIKPVLDLLKEIGGWPLLSHDWKSTEGWEDIVASINRANIASQFPYYLKFHPDPKNSPGTAMMLFPLLSPTRPRVLPDGKRTVEYVKRVARFLNATNYQLDDDIKDCIVFESELYKVVSSVASHGVVSIAEDLMTDYPKIFWKSFFQGLFDSTRMKVSTNTTVIFTHSKYTSKVTELLGKTSVKVIRNYIVWRQIEQAIPVMPEKFREAKNAFKRRAAGPTRNHDCLEMLIGRAKVSIGHLFIRNIFDGQTKNMSQSMIKSIESQAYRFLNNMIWMDKKTNTKLIETLKKLEVTLAHPNDTLDLIEELEFQSNDTTFANYRRLLGSHRHFKYNRLTISPNQEQQIYPFEYDTNVDGHFFSSTDVTFMLAAMLQRPFFDAEQPMYLNYGGIGFTLAHEMTRRLQILSACNPVECQSYELFRERWQCFVNLYGEYSVKQLNETVNGIITARENIGDLIGLRLAYRAYEEFAKDSEEALLPGFNYTGRQWFWINAATTLCRYESDESLRNSIETNELSLAEARVNVAFANIKEFSRDFACSPDSGIVNSTNRCEFE